MSNPILQLRDMLTRSSRITTGVIVSSTSAGLKVSTEDGIKSMSQTDATLYTAGDKVQIQGQIVTGRVSSEAGLQVYTV